MVFGWNVQSWLKKFISPPIFPTVTYNKFADGSENIHADFYGYGDNKAKLACNSQTGNLCRTPSLRATNFKGEGAVRRGPSGNRFCSPELFGG